MHLGHEPVPDPLLQPSSDGLFQEVPRGGGIEAADVEGRQTGQGVLSFGVAYREHHRDRLGEQPSGHELQCLKGDLVQPLRVVDQDEHRPRLRGPGEQREHGEADQEAVGRIPGRHAERHAQGLTLGFRQAVQLVEERRAQLVQARVGQLHVRLDALRPGHLRPGRPRGQILQEHRLPDARLAADHQHPGLSLTQADQQVVECRALMPPTDQVRKRAGDHARGSSGGSGGRRAPTTNVGTIPFTIPGADTTPCAHTL